MFRVEVLHLSVNVILIVLGCFGNFPVNMASSKANVSVESVGDISKACNSFCQDLYKIIASTEKKNVVHSPFGLHTLLSLLSYGADKSTMEELKTALHFSDAHIHQQYKELIAYLNAAETLELTVANAIYVQNEFPIIQQFLDLGSQSFHAEIANIDFANQASAVETINSWVKSKTKNKIQTALQTTDIDRFTRVILLNVIHFKSSWLYPFSANKTVLRDFHVSESVVKKVPIMAREAAFKIGDIPALESQFIEIPYKNSEFVMVIIKPNEIDGLKKLEVAFDASTLSSYEPMTQTVLLKLPKFKFEITTELNNILQQVDIKTMFTDHADFSKMSNSKQPLKVSKVFQKLYVDVNEEGTEAAAVSVGVMRLKRSMIIVEEFVIDRPFMFIIKHKSSDIPLFVGSVRDFEDAEQIRDEL